MIRWRTAERAVNPALSCSALYFSNSARFCDSDVQNSVIFGWFSLYAARSSGVSTTAFMCPTTPHARPNCSVQSSSGTTKSSQLACNSGFSSCATTSRQRFSRVSTAGVTSAGVIASKRGSPEKSSNGFCMVASDKRIIGTQFIGGRSCSSWNRGGQNVRCSVNFIFATPPVREAGSKGEKTGLMRLPANLMHATFLPPAFFRQPRWY